jgi:hypothetical protein
VINSPPTFSRILLFQKGGRYEKDIARSGNIAVVRGHGFRHCDTTQKWTTGWDNFGEPLDLAHSKIVWSVSATRKLTVTFTLKGATPNKLYQVGVHIFCGTFPATFGQFPSERNGDGSCVPITRQGVTKSIAAVEFGVVTTDIHGNGSFKVIVGPIVSGSYDLEFDTRNGAGCGLTGGGGANDPNICEADFQSPGPVFGTATTVVVP